MSVGEKVRFFWGGRKQRRERARRRKKRVSWRESERRGGGGRGGGGGQGVSGAQEEREDGRDMCAKDGARKLKKAGEKISSSFFSQDRCKKENKVMKKKK